MMQEAKVLFRLGGDELWSRPLVFQVSSVITIEPYEREGPAPKVPRCTVVMLNGDKHRVLGTAAHVQKWLGWEVGSIADAYKSFQALEFSSQSADSSSAAAESAGSVRDDSAGGSVVPAVIVSVSDDAPPAGEKEPPVGDGAGAIPATCVAPAGSGALPAESGVHEL